MFVKSRVLFEKCSEQDKTVSVIAIYSHAAMLIPWSLSQRRAIHVHDCGELFIYSTLLCPQLEMSRLFVCLHVLGGLRRWTSV